MVSAPVDERDDQGFGPVLRGQAGPGRSGEGGAPAPRPVARSIATPAGDDGFGPVQRGRASRLGRLGRSLPRVLLAATLTLVLVVGLLGAALLATTLVNLKREQVDGLRSAGGRMNVLVVGSDSREGLTPEELQALGTEAVVGQRTDTIFVLSVRGGAAAMLSLPRDLYVTRCDGSRGRINAAFATGGPSCLVQTVASTTGIPVTHYAEVNLGGFVRIVDAVGGVSVYLDQPLRDEAAGVDLPAGCVHLDGRLALGFVRARKVDSDLGRIARQQRFLAELVDEVLSPATLLDVPGLFRLAQAGASAVTVDRGLGIIDLARLARAGRGLAAGGLATYTVPAIPQTIGGAAVLVPGDEAVAMYQQFASGAVLDVPPAEEVAALSPDDVELAVRNGTGEAGYAGRIAAELEARGFTVTEVGNADPAASTVVRHPPRLAAAAQVVAAAVPGAVTAADDSLEQVELVLGPGAAVAPAPPEGPSEGGEDAPTVPVGAGAVPEGC